MEASTALPLSAVVWLLVVHVVLVVGAALGGEGRGGKVLEVGECHLSQFCTPTLTWLCDHVLE